MGTPLREFIATRRAEIAKKMSMLMRERRELRIALAALDDQNANSRSESGGLTIKTMIVEALRAGGPASAEQLIRRIRRDRGVDIRRSSLSPQLSRLKAEGMVDLDSTNRAWRIAGESREENGEAEASPDTHSSTVPEETSDPPLYARTVGRQHRRT